MNEMMSELLESVQRNASRVGDTAADAAYGVSKKTVELLSVAKLNIRIMERKASINSAMRELGELLYATHKGTPTDSEILLEKMQEIDTLYAEIATMEAQIGREHSQTTCPTCNTSTQEGDAFCRECGEKL